MSLGSSFAVDFVTLLARQCPKTTQAWNDDPMIQGNGFQIIWDSLSKTNHWYHGELEHVGRHIVTPRAPSLRFATPSRRFRARRRSRERLRCVHGKGLVLKGKMFEKNTHGTTIANFKVIDLCIFKQFQYPTRSSGRATKFWHRHICWTSGVQQNGIWYDMVEQAVVCG